jgi:hypothetical protein
MTDNNYAHNSNKLDSKIDSFYRAYMEEHPYARGLDHPPGGPAFEAKSKDAEEVSLPTTAPLRKREWKFDTPLPADEVKSVPKFDPVRQVGRVNPRSAFVPEGSIDADAVNHPDHYIPPDPGPYDNDTVKKDMVNSPGHYTEGNMEAIDVLAAKLTPDQYQGYLQGSVLKYVLRSNYKGKRSEDMKKAQWYLNTLVEADSLNEGE